MCRQQRSASFRSSRWLCCRCVADWLSLADAFALYRFAYPCQGALHFCSSMHADLLSCADRVRLLLRHGSATILSLLQSRSEHTTLGRPLAIQTSRTSSDPAPWCWTCSRTSTPVPSLWMRASQQSGRTYCSAPWAFVTSRSLTGAGLLSAESCMQHLNACISEKHGPCYCSDDTPHYDPQVQSHQGHGDAQGERSCVALCSRRSCICKPV